VQAATLPEALPETGRAALLRQRLTVAPLASGFSVLRDRYGTTLWVLLALMGILLAVACANLAGLTLARSLTRRHQVAVRLALGGSARRVFWQLLFDGILLSTVVRGSASARVGNHSRRDRIAGNPPRTCEVSAGDA
jgi:hypothetical protein